MQERRGVVACGMERRISFPSLEEYTALAKRMGPPWWPTTADAEAQVRDLWLTALEGHGRAILAYVKAERIGDDDLDDETVADFKASMEQWRPA